MTNREDNRLEHDGAPLAASDALADAGWIGGPGNALCRLAFTLRDRPARATLSIVADPHTYAIAHWQPPASEYKYEQWLVGGSFVKYRVFANAALVAVGPFRPIEDGVPTLQRYEVAQQLTRGRNALAVHSRGEARGFALCLDVIYDDGASERIVSGDHWRQLPANDIYRPVNWECQAIDQHFKGGPGPGEYPEHIDGRVYPHGWRTAEFDDATWPRARVFGRGVGDVEACRTPNYTLTRVQPVAVTKVGPDAYLLDFGRAMFAGIEMRAPAAGVVELRLAEELTEEGRARYQLRAECCYQERWTFDGGDDALAHFGLRMFRYAEVVGWRGGEPRGEDITATIVAMPFDATRSTFTCSDARLERVWQFCKNSIPRATADVYTDCLTRERLAYEADGYLSMLTQFCTEGTSETARRTLAYLTTHPTWPAEWWQTFVPAFHAFALHTGDLDFVRQHYPFLREHGTFHRLMQGGLIRRFPRECMVDWPPAYRDGYVFGDGNAVANAYAHLDLTLLGTLAEWLELPSDAREYAAAAAELRDGFNATLFDEATGLYLDSLGSRHSSLHANLFALAFDLVPAERVAGVLAFVKSRGMACGVYTAHFLLETLFRHDEAEAAVALMTRDGERSWLDMMRRGATVTTEAWRPEDKPNMSWAHPWGAAPANIVVRRLFGLRPTAPGWSDYVFDPQPGGLERGRLTVSTPRGPFVASFERQGDRYQFNLLPNLHADGRPSRRQHRLRPAAAAGGLAAESWKTP